MLVYQGISSTELRQNKTEIWKIHQTFSQQDTPWMSVSTVSLSFVYPGGFPGCRTAVRDTPCPQALILTRNWGSDFSGESVLSLAKDRKVTPQICTRGKMASIYRWLEQPWFWADFAYRSFWGLLMVAISSLRKKTAVDKNRSAPVRHNSHFHFRVFLEAVDSPLRCGCWLRTIFRAKLEAYLLVIWWADRICSRFAVR